MGLAPLLHATITTTKDSRGEHFLSTSRPNAVQATEGMQEVERSTSQSRESVDKKGYRLGAEGTLIQL